MSGALIKRSGIYRMNVKERV